MKNAAHPEAILRTAWNTHRLDAIRSIVDNTIRELQASDPRTLLGSESVPTERQPAHDAVRQALVTCCNELREGCGLPPCGPLNDAGLAAEQQPDWRQSYDDALARYRDVAGAALQAALSEAASAGPASAVDP